jgi:hypothetical protein
VVSTFLSYDLINRDIKSSLTRVSQQGMVDRQTAYYKENISKVSSVDEFLDDYRLYSYAMDAFGLEEMTYAKAFMRKVLESDLNDENSFANKLTDERYRDFAAAFNFSSTTETLQTEAQYDDLIGIYGKTIKDADAALGEETRYYKAMVDKVDNVDRFLRNDRLRAYTFQVFGLDEKSYSYSHIRGLMTSDLDDPNSYLNQQYGAAYQDAVGKLATKGNIELHARVTTRIGEIDEKLGDGALTTEERDTLIAERAERVGNLGEIEALLPPQADWENTLAAINAEATKLQARVTQFTKMSQIAQSFNFNSDGTVGAGGTQTVENLKMVTEAYVGNNARVTPTVAALMRDYFATAMQNVTNLNDLMADARLVSFVRTAFDLTGVTIVNATIRNILTSDLEDPNNYIATIGKNKPEYLALRAAFNFLEDGSLPADTPAQTAAQLAKTNDGYNSHYDDAAEAADAKALANYKIDLLKVNNVKDFVASKAVLDYALKAVGLDPSGANIRTIREVLKSDLQDPKSFVYTLKDDRYVKLAEMFNFKTDGTIGAPVLAQSSLDMQTMSADYIKTKSVFGTPEDRTAADKEAEYYGEQMMKVKSLKDLLGNPRLINFAMEALGLDPKSVTQDQLKMMFASDVNDPDSYLNKNFDTSYRALVTAFNFDQEGVMMREDRNAVQTRRGLVETVDRYIRQTMEVQAGEDNQGVRMALYFQRIASSVTSYYTILADSALQEFINTAYGIPGEMANASVDTQVEMMKRYFDIEDFRDPKAVSKLIARFTIMYDQNTGTSDPIMMLFNGSGSAGISADTLLNAASLRFR